LRFFLQRLLVFGKGRIRPPLFLTMTDEKSTKRDLAEKLLQKGKYDEAIVLLEDIHQESPDEDPVLLMLAWAYYDSGKTGQAEKCLTILFDRELERKVFTGFAFDELVRLYKQKKDFPNLVNICERAVAAQPDDVGLLTELGNAYLQAGQADRARLTYEKLIAMEDDNPAFYCLWGEALFAAGLNKESEDAYRKAGQLDPDQLDSYYFRIAVLFQKADNHQEARRLLNKCLNLNPSSPLYYCSLGDSLIGLGKLQDAINAYNQAVEFDRADADAYYNRLGNSLMKTGNFSEAVAAFQTAIRLEPLPIYYLNLSSAYRKMGLDHEADQTIGKADKIH